MSRNMYGIMIKYPEPGRVKTRLAKDIGDHRAAEICREIAELIMANTDPCGQAYQRTVLYDPPERLPDFEQWLPGNLFVLQRGDNVGGRMDNAIRDLLARGAEKVVLTGADIPALNAAIITGAFAALDHADIVIGPAADGGYYLIGMKGQHGEIFRSIPWSTERVFETTVRLIRASALRWRELVTLRDIDRAEDLQDNSGSPGFGH